jgi:hypothetical protein
MVLNKIIIGPWNNAPDIKQAGGSGYGGPGGGGGGMELRIGLLETHVDYLKHDVADIKAASELIRNDVTSVRVQLGQLVEHVSHLPSKGFIIKGVMGALAMLAALIAFQQQIQKLLGFH